MYVQHFDFKKRPFRANATGTDVFVGPQIAATMASLKAAFSARDAIAAVCGPVGSGKTTLALRALDSIGINQKVIHIGRMRLDSADVLELLLRELGIDNPPNGTIQRFATFRRRLQELQESGSRVFLAVEDSARLGVDTLAEIEALTAADAGESDGASVLLMGDEDLDELLTDSQLGRTAQRMRKCHVTTPFCAAELRGYLRHCFRLAGGDFEQLFAANVAPLLHHLCGGLPRVTNNLVDAVLQTAANRGLETVTSQLVIGIAEKEFGLDASGFDLTPIAVTADVGELEKETNMEASIKAPVTEEPAVVEAPIDAAVRAEPGPPQIVITTPAGSEFASPELTSSEQIIAEPVAIAPQVAAPTAAEPIIVFSDEDVNSELPDLIQDTLPDLEVIAPGLKQALDTASESSAVEVPAWDRDPTMAELKPDLAALEEALASVRSNEPPPNLENPEASPPAAPEIPELIPEITLDHAINQRIASNLIDEPGEISPPGAASNDTVEASAPDLPVVSLSPDKNKSPDSELEKIATELAKAKSIDDVDDKMAETLFGDELSLAAAQFVSAPESTVSANEDMDAQYPATPTPPTGEPTENNVEVTLEAPETPDDGGMDLSASQRLKTVRALNADLHPSLQEPQTSNTSAPPAAPAKSPDSIEDQINTSMTQTLKALNVNRGTNNSIVDDVQDDEKNGFFGRFKRS